MTLPDTSTYTDIHTGMMALLSKLNSTRLQEYLHQFNQSFDSKIKEFHKQRFVRFLRVSVGQNGCIYLSSMVWAEMKKKVFYNVDTLLEGTGVIREVQCECGAGQGPGDHCKHVITVLYATIRCIEAEKIITEVTCTQVLQTFHRAKPHKGSPLKLTATIGSDKTRSLRYDPRGDSHREQQNYNSDVRNLCLNHQANFEGSMPVLQIFAPANLHAVVLDHDYMKYDAAYQFLLNEKLISIDAEERGNLEVFTRGQNKNSEWKRVRALRLSASNFGRIVKGTDRETG